MADRGPGERNLDAGIRLILEELRDMRVEMRDMRVEMRADRRRADGRGPSGGRGGAAVRRGAAASHQALRGGRARVSGKLRPPRAWSPRAGQRRRRLAPIVPVDLA